VTFEGDPFVSARNSESTRLNTKFSELGLSDPILRTLDGLGYEHATPIQAQAIPVVLQGSDLVGCAQTGTGKTAAFLLPLLDLLKQAIAHQPVSSDSQPNRRSRRSGKRTLRALVLSPTRELAAQIGDSMKKYGQNTPLRHTVVFGGVPQFRQVRAMQHGVDVLVATPGRLLDLMNQGHIDLSTISTLVLDEADQMLDMGFLPALKRIVAAVPVQRQTLMFSATMPPEIRKLASQWLSEPENIKVAAIATPAERIEQTVYMVDKNKKIELLLGYLKNTSRSRTMVFMRTKHEADKLVKILDQEGLKAAAIHGNKSQGARMRTLQQFKGKNPPILVATDIASRGLDVRDVSHIVNFDLPEVPETYVHRIGRTARAGAEGVAISYCTRGERKRLAAIERLMNVRINIDQTNLSDDDFPRYRKGPGGGKPGGGRSSNYRPRKSASGSTNGGGSGGRKRRRRPKAQSAS